MWFTHVKTKLQLGPFSCGLFVVYFVRELLSHWPPTEGELVHEDGPVPWLAAETNEVETLREELSTWVVSRMEVSSLSGLLRDMGNSIGTAMLRREYFDTFLQEKLKLDPYAVIEAQNLDKPDGPDPVEAPDYERVKISLSRLAEEISEPERGQRLNALSIPSNHLIGDANDVWQLVADDVEAQRSVTAASHIKQVDERRFFAEAALEPRGFFILSAAGTVHPVHVDGSGFCMLIGVIDSHKIFILGCPTRDTAPTPPNTEGGDPFILMQGPDVTVYLIVIKTTDLLLMPSWTYHAVATLNLKPAILQGTFFDSRYVMKRTLAGLVECALWHDHWTNTLYKERFVILAFLHARAPPSKARFTGENLYALLFAAKYSMWLVPFTAATPQGLSAYDPPSLLNSHDPNGVHAFLLRRANQLIQLLPSDEKILFRNFERRFKEHIGNEYKSMYNVLKENEE